MARTKGPASPNALPSMRSGLSLADVGAGYAQRERLLHRLWADGRLSSRPLPSSIGPLQAVFPGWANHDRGPDFHEAIIAREDGRLLKGDVEIHIHARDWDAHGHGQDPAYNRVVLHVVWRGDEDFQAATAAGDAVPTASLEGALDLPLEVLLLAGRDDGRDPRPCLRKSRDAGVSGMLLDREGDARFLARSTALAGDAAAMGVEQAIYHALLDALGYSKNRLPFRELAQGLPFEALAGTIAGKRPEERLVMTAGILTGAAGLPNTPDGADAWREYGGAVAVGTPWVTFRVRPENAPSRRVLQAADLVRRFADIGLLEGLLKVVRTEGPETLPERLAQELPFGAQRGADAVVNVVLPFFHAWASERREDALAAGCLEAYRRHKPLASNQVVREMQTLLLEPGEASRTVNTARRQQGLLHLYKKRCHELLCAGCAFGQAGHSSFDRLRTGSEPIMGRNGRDIDL